jgi:hypothetical protein
VRYLDRKMHHSLIVALVGADVGNADRVEFRLRVEDFIGMQLCDTDLAKLSLPGHPALHHPTDREVPFAEAELPGPAWPTAALTPIEGGGHRRIMQSGTTTTAPCSSLAKQPVGIRKSI